ncbi:MAG: DUF1080 domain-containing protein [Pirellulaceae bacterium]|nr:DUF1080 domain-containing protein [Pirellulaceae bacterium]
MLWMLPASWPPAARLALASFAMLSATLAVSPADAQTNWPRWRGPEGTGHTDQQLPVEWTADDVQWRTELPGVGQSSPVVWGDRVFLTASEEKGRQRIVMCLDRTDGKLLWQHVAWTGDPETTHAMNPWASASCATDGQHVAAFFGRGGLHCYDFEGNKLWSRELGNFEGPWGTASSPVIVDDLVIQTCDADDQAFMIGLNVQTGAEVWRTPRQPMRGWSTPILVQRDGRRELIVNGHYGINAYDPATGKDLWFCQGSTGRGTPTVAPFEDLVISVCGRPGEMVACRMGGNGDVSQSHEAWRVPRRGGRDLPSPTVVGKYLMVISFRPGIASCYDAASGKELWKERLAGEFSASPIVSRGLIYIPSEQGETCVIRPGERLDVVARNRVNNQPDEIFRASLAPSDGQLLLRSDSALYCIGKPAEQKSDDSGDSQELEESQEQQEPEQPGKSQESTGFRRSLFNGQDLRGWQVSGCQAAVENGLLVLQDGNGLVRTEQRYDDFVLELSWRARREANWDSGIYFRCELPPEGKPWPARYQANLRQGQEGNVGGLKDAQSQGLIKPGQWNHFKLQVVGATATLEINGQPAWKADGIEAASGYIALQAEVPGGGQFEFKDIYLTELNMHALFNGQDLDGWEGAGKDAALCWKVEEGLLQCTGEKGPWLRTKAEYDDFNLRLDYRLKAGGNSGVYVRVPEDGNHHGAGAGVEIQILDDDAERYKTLKPYQYTGSVYAIAPSTQRVGRAAGEWNSLEIECRGTSYRVVHNGATIVKADAESFAELAQRRVAGYLGLQNHSEQVWFRDIRIGPPLAR